MNSIIIVVTNMQNRNINKKVGCGYYDEMSPKKKNKRAQNQNEFTMQNDS
jgi:hypothetical protein